MKNKKSFKWQLFKSNRNEFGRYSPQALGAWHEFVLANREIKSYTLSCKCEYELRLALSLKEKPKLFHGYI